VKKENELTFQRFQWFVLRMIDVWMCGVKVTDRFTCCELRERLGTDDVSTIVQ